MPTIPKIGTAYFLGIGGIGMSALARYFLSKGWKVYGYDRTPTLLTGQLRNEGMKIHFQEDIDRIPSIPTWLSILQPFLPNNSELRFFKELGIPVLKRLRFWA